MFGVQKQSMAVKTITDSFGCPVLSRIQVPLVGVRASEPEPIDTSSPAISNKLVASACGCNVGTDMHTVASTLGCIIKPLN